MLPSVLLSDHAGSMYRYMHDGTTGKSILIVDDNQAAADSLAKLLCALGWNASGLYSARAALDYLKTNSPDGIFLDIGMPEMDGYELVAILRANGHLMPIIALSGYGLEDDKDKARAAGFTTHLTKPAGAKELTEVLARVGL